MNILTFDIEDWFHILDNSSTKSAKQWSGYETRIHANTDRILNLLTQNNHKATFFCLGWVARRHPEVIKAIDNAGFEIASHSDMHQLSYELDRRLFSEDLHRSITSIQDVIGKPVRAFRAPGFSFRKENTWVFDVLLEQGITHDCSIFPAQRAHGGFPDFGTAQPAVIRSRDKRLKEFPINTFSLLGKSLVFSGGGYFRILPYGAVKYLMKRSPYVMTYFHPRDFDPNQPLLAGLSGVRRFKSYVGLSHAFDKLQSLLNDFSFTDLTGADEMVDWENAKMLSFSIDPVATGGVS